MCCTQHARHVQREWGSKTTAQEDWVQFTVISKQSSIHSPAGSPAITAFQTCHPLPFAFQQTCHLQGSIESLLSYFTAACLQSSGLGFLLETVLSQFPASWWLKWVYQQEMLPLFQSRPHGVIGAAQGLDIAGRLSHPLLCSLRKAFSPLWARGLLDEISCIPLL